MRRFIRCAAAASVLSAATTLLLIFLPSLYSAAEGFEGRMMRVQDPAYQLRAWVAWVHPLLATFAALAIALRLRGESLALAVCGGAGFLVWGVVELVQQSLTLAAFDPWRLSWIAGDAQVRAEMPLRTALYDGIWDALYLTLLVGIIIGSACYARLTWHAGALRRAISVLYALAALLSCYFLATSLGAPKFLPAAIVFWFYPLTQPLARTLIGIWLWRAARGDAAANE